MKNINPILIIYLFLLIYNPPILSNISVLHIIGALSWIYLFLNVKYIFKRFYLIPIMKTFFILVLVTLYIVLIATVNNNSISVVVGFLYWIIDILPGCIAVIVSLSKRNKELKDLINILLIVGTIQGLTALLAFLFPAIQEFFLNQLLAFGYNEVYKELGSVRMFGYASNLTFSTPVVQSFLGCLSIYMGIKDNKKYLIYSPLLFFSGIINARISFVVIIVGIISILLSSNKKLKIVQIIKMIPAIIVVIILFNYILDFLAKTSLQTYQWIMRGYNEVIMFFQGDTSGIYFSYVTDSKRYSVPNDIGLLFGKGVRIMGGSKYGFSSDIGYINDIWLGGLFYSLVIYLLFIVFLLNIWRLGNREHNFNKLFFYFFISVFIVGNIKGYIFDYNNFTTLFFLIYLFILLKPKKKT